MRPPRLALALEPAGFISNQGVPIAPLRIAGSNDGWVWVHPGHPIRVVNNGRRARGHRVYARRVIPCGSRLRAPTSMLAEAAKIVQDDYLVEVRGALEARFSAGFAGAAERIADRIEYGLTLLAGQIVQLEGDRGFSMKRIESCRKLAERDSRLRFIYALPNSASWGAAIGATIDQTLFKEARDPPRMVTALLNVFMTILDGLLDEAPEVIRPRLGSLLDLVADGAAGKDVSGIPPPGDHPYNDLCFLVAKLWIGQFNQLCGARSSSRRTFVDAVMEAMRIEIAVCDLRFESGPPSPRDLLYGRTGWPLWTQVLVSACQDPWPHEVHFGRFRQLIFHIGDFAAYLDDVRDYVADCRAHRWNSVSSAYYDSFPFPFASADDIEAQLLLAMSDGVFGKLLIETGVQLHTRIDEAVAACGAVPDGLNALITDLAYVYLS
jgi:hypothetical protein